MKYKNIKGVTLIELMITLVVFSIIFGMVYSVYNTFLKQATIERKTEKTELDVVATFWPFLKDIEAAGFGTPKTGACSQAIILSGNELTIHSTATGNDKYAGRWSYINNDCTVPDMADIPSSENVAIVSGDDRSFLGFSQISEGKLTSCLETYKGKFAYWVPNNILGCYEVKYAISNYNPGTEPAMCKNTQAMVLRKSISTTIDPNWQPLLDCVFGTDNDGDRGLNFRFGCIDSSGNLIWRTDTNCGTNKLRFIKIGLVIQSSPRKDIQGPATITLFEDLDPSYRVTINLNNEQRFYRWRILEQTIVLKNPA